MVALILINYISGLCIEHFDQKPALRRTFLLVALIGSLGMLFYFKYANFVLRSANALLGTAFAEIQGIGTLPLASAFTPSRPFPTPSMFTAGCKGRA